jgi:hypothetical protein
MTRYLLALALLTATAAQAQEGPTPTQALIALDSKPPAAVAAANIVLKVDNRVTPLSSLTPIPSNGVEVALLLDDGLRTSVGRELEDMKAFVTGLPPGTEVFVGYMQNGRVVPGGNLSGFTSDLAAAAQGLRLPLGMGGVSASPYFSLSDFVKNWPGLAENQPVAQAAASAHKARFVLMITNGVDLYNGSTSVLNQDSPYVTNTITDAQRAGIPVYSIYFSDAGFRGRGRSGSFSGQSYLAQLAQGTGGVAYYQGLGNPVSMAPFFKQFQQAISDTYVATFTANANKRMVNLRVSTNLPKTKFRTQDQIRPGTVVLSQ